MTKTLKQICFFFHQNQNIFSATLGIRIFFSEKKKYTHPFKLYGRFLRRAWGYQRGNQNLYMKNRQHNSQRKKDKKLSTKHTHKTKDRVTRTSLQTGSELRYSVLRVSSSCSTSDTRRVNRVVVTFTIGTSHSGLLRSILTQKHTYIYIYTSFEQERRKTTTTK